MASWEFLVQKEGDNSWLTLESPDVEILEGRYRMVARSGYTNTSIDVRIIYQDFEALPPVQQIQTRTLTTNSEGLMVVMPYTSLKPGNWQFSCSPQLTSGLLSTVGKRTIQLRVLPVDLEDLDQPFEETEPETVNIIPTESVHTELTPEPSPKIVQFPTSRSNPVAEPPQPQVLTPETPLSLVEESPQPLQAVETLLKALHLSLDQDSFVARLGQPVIIWGRIELPIASPSQPSTSVYPVLPSCELQFRLRDPQTAEPLFQVSQLLRFSDFPLSFSGVVYIPFECKTRLILGEVIFSHDGVPVTTESFNIVTQVEHLLEAIDQGFGTQQDQEDFPDLSTLDLGVLELPDLSDNIKTTHSPSAEAFTPEIATILPPKIHSSGTDSRPSTSLDLPTFGRRDEPWHVCTTTQEVQTPGVPVSEDLSIGVETSESTSTDIPVSISPLSIPAPDSIVESEHHIPKPKQDPEVQQAFQALDLNNRFWSRLNSLAQDRSWSQWVKRANVNPLPEIPFNAATNIVKRSDHDSDDDRQDAYSTVFSEVIHLYSQSQEELEEIVVDDEPLESPAAFFSKRKLGKETKPETSTTNQPIPYILSEDQPVPDPEIEVLTTEIIAGRLVKVRVRLPDGLPRIYVKVWLFDRQTRSVVDGPRWLTEFSPNGFDQIETTVDLEVPYSSLEVLFEAIAVEMQTQRESNKITIERSVNPPPAPSLPL